MLHTWLIHYCALYKLATLAVSSFILGWNMSFAKWIFFNVELLYCGSLKARAVARMVTVLWKETSGELEGSMGSENNIWGKNLFQGSNYLPQVEEMGHDPQTLPSWCASGGYCPRDESLALAFVPQGLLGCTLLEELRVHGDVCFPGCWRPRKSPGPYLSPGPVSCFGHVLRHRKNGI